MATKSLLSEVRGASHHPARAVVIEDSAVSSSSEEEASTNALSIRNDLEEIVTIDNSFETNDQSATEQVVADANAVCEGNNDETPISSSCCNCLPAACVRSWLIRNCYKNKKWIALWVTFLFRICLYTTDWVFDIKLLHEYRTDGHWWYFGLTFLFVFLPAIFVSVVNWIYYTEKYNYKRDLRKTLSTWKFRLRRLSCVLLISPVAKHIDIFCCGWKQLSAEKEKEMRSKKIRKKKEMEILIFFQLFESAVESSPQLFLQMYILATKLMFMNNQHQFVDGQLEGNSTLTINQTSPPNVNLNDTFKSSSQINNQQSVGLLMLQIGSIFISVFGMSSCYTGFTMQIFWGWSRVPLFLAHFITIGSRVVILGFFAASVTIHIWFVIVIHCLLMLIVFRRQIEEHQPTSSKISKWVWNTLISSQIFTILPIEQRRLSLWRYIQHYYGICFMENLMMLIWWAVATYTDPTTPLWLAVVIGQPLSFLFGFAMYNMVECCAAGLLEPSLEEYSSIDRNSQDHRKWKKELEHLCTKGKLNAKDLWRLEYLVLDRKVNLNYRKQERVVRHYRRQRRKYIGVGRTPLLLLCSRKTNESDGILSKYVEIMLKRKDIKVNLCDYEGSDALTLLCKHYQGNDLNSVMLQLIHHDTMADEDYQPHFYLLSTVFWLVRPYQLNRIVALLNLCQFHEGISLKEALGTLIDYDDQMMEAKNENGDSVLTLLFGRRSAQNRRIDLVDIVRFAMERGRQWNRTKWKDEIVNGQNCQGRNALHVLCNVYNKNFIELVRLLVSEGINSNSGDGAEQNALYILLSSTDYNSCDELFQLVEFLLEECHIDSYRTTYLARKKEYAKNDPLDILFSSCSGREDLIDIFRLLVGPSVYPNPRDGELTKALIPLCTSTKRIIKYYKRFATCLVNSGKIDVNAVTADEEATVLHLLCTHYHGSNLVDMISFLIEKNINVKATNKRGENALDLLCQHYNHGQKEPRYNGHHRQLLPIVKLLVEETEDGTALIQTGSPLYLLLQHYEGDDLMDVVRYFVIEKKIPFDKEKALELLEQRNDLPDREAIAQILSPSAEVVNNS